VRIVADLHIHSRFSLATSPKLTVPHLDRWARIKGIDLVGTGDCTHPAWLAELQESMEDAEDGFFVLKEALRGKFDAREALAEGLPAGRGGAGGGGKVRFVLTGEISTIYSRDGRTRKVHHLVILPDFAAAAAFQSALERVGNIASDGRPILGLDSRDLLAMLLDADDRSLLVPAHVWTPWFSALGARSGFDSIAECYGDLSPRIGAIETGLSSNPPMNWAVSSLDRYSIISNSDAHSPEKLGREATIIDMDPSFRALAQALSGGGPEGDIRETVEFFPQEGKYHYDGHRACGVVLDPAACAAAGGLCPSCGKPLTPGVLRRVAELADRPVAEDAPCPAETAGTNRRPYRSLIPLPELIGELLGCGPASKKAAAAYGALIEGAGSEFSLLLDLGIDDISKLSAPGVSGELLAAAVGRMRRGEVFVQPGYDGEYGAIRAFAPGAVPSSAVAPGLFGEDSPPSAKPAGRRRSPASRPAEGAAAGRPAGQSAAVPAPGPVSLDAAQERAANHPGGPCLVLAGPGTGKTAVLARRVARLIGQGAAPASILALTFTNKAARELRERIAGTVGAEAAAAVTAATFHSFCLTVLRERAAEAGLPADFSVLDEEARERVLRAVAGSAVAAKRLGAYAEGRKRFLLRPGDAEPQLGPGAPAGLAALAREFGAGDADPEWEGRSAAYRDALRAERALDFDDLVAGAARLLSSRPAILADYRARYRFVFVDEFQDVNFAQYALARILAPGGAGTGASGPDLCVVGDPNQAIYGFRGSDRRFIDRFSVDYPGAAVYPLERTFRCAAPIIGAASRLVGASFVGVGEAVALVRSEYPSGASEAEGIAREIDRLIGGTRFFALDSGVARSGDAELRGLGECAILVRAAALIPAIEKALSDHGLPCRRAGDRPWWAEEPARSLVEVLRSGAIAPGLSLSEAVRGAAASIGPAAGAGPALAEAASRLAERAEVYGDLRSFLDDLSLGSPQDGLPSRSGGTADGGAERISVLTIHSAKGLEWDRVFVAGLEDGMLPFTLYGDGEGNGGRLDEERRLLYVAMTRARKALHLSWAKTREFKGRVLELPPSRFLAELEDLVPRAEDAPRRARDPQLGLF
jgi:uncharacterized protein (TIGR00375 family)